MGAVKSTGKAVVGTAVFVAVKTELMVSAIEATVGPAIPKPPIGQPKPPGWSKDWEWRYPEANEVQ